MERGKVACQVSDMRHESSQVSDMRHRSSFAKASVARRLDQVKDLPLSGISISARSRIGLLKESMPFKLPSQS